MGKIRGFLEHTRREAGKLPVGDRIRNFREFEDTLEPREAGEQGARCMGCGIPFCHSGCPLGNEIPDWNHLVYRDRWMHALRRLHATNNFPEITGRVCPAPCEAACVLNINDDAVAIKQIERAIADRGWEEGWIVPTPPATRSHFRVAVIGSGPAGLACAQQLARAGHQVTVFERDEQPGGLLRYGIPDFKLEKHWIDKRIAQMQREGVQFRTGVEVGVHISGTAIRDEFHAVCIATGAMKPRDLPIPGRQFAGVHFAMDYLAGQNRVVSGALAKPPLTAAGKRVIVLGGGDTGSDCVGTANRQGAESVTQIELLPRPPEAPTSDMLWPNWPMVLRTSTSHEEGVEREWSLLTERFTGDAGGNVTALQVSRLLWDTDAQGRRTFVRDPAGARELQAELVLLALGFEGCAQSALYRELGVELSAQGSVRGNGGTPSDGFATGAPGVYACGDARRGASLVVWAIWEGREAARQIDRELTASAGASVSAH